MATNWTRLISLLLNSALFTSTSLARLLFFCLPGLELIPVSPLAFVIIVQLHLWRNSKVDRAFDGTPPPLAPPPLHPREPRSTHASTPKQPCVGPPASLTASTSRQYLLEPAPTRSTPPRLAPRSSQSTTMVTQRRYSVTGQTPPDDAEAMKAESASARSPKLHALDTSASRFNTTTGDDGGAEPVRGRKMAQAGTVVRTSSKRSATQLPSPNSPSHELPPKIARYRLGHSEDVDTDGDTDTDSDVTDDLVFASQATSMPTTPECSQPPHVWDLPDAASLQKLQLSGRVRSDDDCMEDLALSPSHSRNHSVDCSHAETRSTLQQDWAAYTRSQCISEPESIHVEHVAPAQPDDSCTAPTFLTLPPEIRHQIYRNCEELVFRQPLLYCIATAFDKIQHPLASVSRQVRSEALAIFYSYNTWTVKVEFRMMYDGFQHWIIRLGDGAGSLRLVDLSVRGTLFKPKRTHTQSVLLGGQLIQITPGVATNGRQELYSPPDGDASFKIDLSEKHVGGKVCIMRNDGTQEAGETGRAYLAKKVEELWDKRRAGTLNGQDWVNMVDNFITFIGGW
ncbi:hypothetical protein EK21DRAFT_62976 [Setomelanomma holmii]|uniref:F-box domain-containing protein n=1 Tax=Setomelanomma holmii TaxID=210430 RepID=A0A9P4LN18_9PLEO|nr:hypothetical protein EK21DRAFT_62976 [Setomelanomma holmii]